MEKLYAVDRAGAQGGKLREITARMRKQLVRDITNRVRPEGATADEINRYYCCHFEPYAYNILILRVITRKKSEKFAPEPFLLMAEERMREALIPVFYELETAIVDGRIVCIFNITTHRDSSGTEAFKLAISRFFAELSTSPDFPGCDFIMGEGTPAESVEDLDDCYISAVQAMEYGIIYGLNKKYDSYVHVQAYGNIMSILTAGRRSNLKYCLDTLNRGKMRELLNELFAVSEGEIRRSPGLAYLLPHKVLDLCSAAIGEYSSPSYALEQALAEQHQRVDNCLCLDEIKSVTWEGILALFNWYESALSSGSSLAVYNAKIYIHENYDKKLPLSELAEHVQLNPQYLSVLFKKEAGNSVVGYLTDIRIDKAKSLLRNTNFTILETAESVGYTDARYFSRVFKSRVGLRPTEYRKSLLKHDESIVKH